MAVCYIFVWKIHLCLNIFVVWGRPQIILHLICKWPCTSCNSTYSVQGYLIWKEEWEVGRCHRRRNSVWKGETCNWHVFCGICPQEHCGQSFAVKTPQICTLFMKQKLHHQLLSIYLLSSSLRCSSYTFLAGSWYHFCLFIYLNLAIK